MSVNVTRGELERTWTEHTGLDDCGSSPLTQAIISETLEASDGDRDEAVKALEAIIADVSALINGIISDA